MTAAVSARPWGADATGLLGPTEGLWCAPEVGAPMADEELILAGLDALEGLIGVLIEDAHD